MDDRKIIDFPFVLIERRFLDDEFENYLKEESSGKVPPIQEIPDGFDRRIGDALKLAGYNQTLSETEQISLICSTYYVTGEFMNYLLINSIVPMEISLTIQILDWMFTRDILLKFVDFAHRYFYNVGDTES